MTELAWFLAGFGMGTVATIIAIGVIALIASNRKSKNETKEIL